MADPATFDFAKAAELLKTLRGEIDKPGGDFDGWYTAQLGQVAETVDKALAAFEGIRQ